MENLRVRTTPAALRAVASGATGPVLMPVHATATADPFRAYRAARGAEPSVIYETRGGRSGWGYFGVDPSDIRTVDAGGALPVLERLEEERSFRRGDCPVPYPGGWFGWLAYDVAREIETLPESTIDDRGLPRAQFARYPTIAAWAEPHDPPTTVHLVSAVSVDDDAAAAHRVGVRRIRTLVDRCNAGVAPETAPSEAVTFRATVDRSAYRERVRRVQEYISAGDTFQANISHRMEAPATVDPIAVYAALRTGNPAPYMGLVEFPGVDLVSASPELLLRIEGDRLVTEPIAGTRPRGSTPPADRRLAAQLRQDRKEAAEHAMLVDLERNDLGKVSEYGSVSVEEYRRIDRYSEVMHLVSRVTGRRRPDVGLADAVAAVFPGGTITGAPKPRTMEIIEELERTRRGPYTGSMGVVGFDGHATFNIIIRTIVRADDRYALRVGGGVVHDSEPDQEYDETLAKARALLTALETASARDRAPEVEG